MHIDTQTAHTPIVAQTLKPSRLDDERISSRPPEQPQQDEAANNQDQRRTSEASSGTTQATQREPEASEHSRSEPPDNITERPPVGDLLDVMA